MDEPTAALADHEVELLYAIIRGLTARGVAILYVSHRLKEIFDLCDTITVLKDGRQVATRPAAELDDAALVRLMVGRSMSSFFPDAARGHRRSASRGSSSRGAGNGYVDGVDLTLRAGEIVGVAGLQGSGRTELLEADLRRHARSPAARCSSTARRSRSARPARPIRAGLAMITEDRKATGLALNQSILDNALGVVRAVFPRAPAPPAARCPACSPRSRSRPGRWTRRCSSSPAATSRRSCWPAGSPPARGVVLMDEPTRGIDVGAKHAIYELMRSAGRRGRRRPDGLQRAARGDRHVRPDPGDERRPDRRRAARAGPPRRPSCQLATGVDPSRRDVARMSRGRAVRPSEHRDVDRHRLRRAGGRHRRRRDPHRRQRPQLLQRRQHRHILTATSILGFIAIGQTLVILVGSLDLSVPFVASLTSVLAGGIMAGRAGNIVPGGRSSPWRSPPVIGLANGLIVSFLHVHGFIATLGTGLIISGYLATNYQGSHGSRAASIPADRRHPGRPGADLDPDHARLRRRSRS